MNGLHVIFKYKCTRILNNKLIRKPYCHMLTVEKIKFLIISQSTNSVYLDIINRGQKKIYILLQRKYLQNKRRTLVYSTNKRN